MLFFSELSPLQKKFFRFAQFIAVLAPVMGTLVLVGWIIKNPYLVSILPGYATMKPVTAICFILLGCSLGLRSVPPGLLSRRLIEFFLAIVLSLSVLSLIEDCVGDFPGEIGTLVRAMALMASMSLATALNFVLLSLALLFLDLRTSRGFWPAQAFALAVIIVAFVGVAGYIYGPQALYRSLPYASMALHTAILFVLVGLGTLFIRPDQGWGQVITSPQGGGWMARRLLPITTFFPFCIASLRTHGEKLGLYDRELGLAIFATTNICVMGTLVWISARALNRSDEGRRRGEKELQKANQQLHEEILRRRQAQDLLRQNNDDLELKVAERTAKLQVANRELEAFSYSVSHDLRAPLRAINGYSRLLQESGEAKLDDEEKNYLTRVCVNGDRMGALIDALLKLSRLSRSEMKISTVNLSQLATQVAEEIAAAQPARKVSFTAQPQLMIRGDESLLRIVLENLLGNAWKFTGKKEDATVSFGQRDSQGKPAYFISDNGAGFDMAYAGKLFGAFQRLHAQEDFDGSGVGLATVQRIIHRHNGTIWAEGKVDQGATMYFTLPEMPEGDFGSGI